ncbi:redox-sensing transcriptional repressor Rex [Mycoplasma sp. P36-A1]|uniref:redox-sensing transcriptional repressor Rex n=1 Tax=Mycoplasma sp. P36-A1 TaxID=3252900 RepID=UPI003C2E5D2C
MSKFVPYATRKRLPLYYKLLKALLEKGVTDVTSTEIAKLVKIDSTTIRRDFSSIGKLGKKGTGYHVETMLTIFEEEFELNKIEKVILVGLGQLGKAVASYFDGFDSVSMVTQIYDTDPTIIGTEYMNIEILDYLNIENTLDKDATIAVLTVPGDSAQDILDNLVSLGIKGFVNFSGKKVFCEKDNVLITDIDIAQVVQSLVYDLRSEY